MKRVMWLSLLVLSVALAALALCANTMKCPLHDNWTANYLGTRMIDGVPVGVYHCPFGSPESPSGHDFVVRCP